MDAGLLAGILTSTGVGGLTGLIQLGEPQMAGGIPPASGLAPESVAALATDLAAGYSQNNGVQTLLLNLEPDHLGRVEVRLQAKGDHLSVRLVAANPEAESALRENLKDLTEAIQVRTGRFQQMEVRVELKDAPGTERDAEEKNPPDFQGQDAPDGQDSNPDNQAQSDGPRETPMDAEPDLWAQEG